MEKVSIPRRHWSSDNESMLEESTRDHYIDVVSRRFAVETLAADLKKGNSVFLDAGCSTGWLLDDVHRLFPNVRAVGADPFLSGLKKMMGRSRGVGAVQFDLCRAPFDDDAFDAIACLNVLEHIEEDEAALGQIRRMLKPAGSAFLMVPAGPGLYDYFDEVHQHVRRYEKREFAEKMASAGLSVRRLSYMGIFLFPAFYAVKKYNQWKMRGKSMDEKKERVIKDVGPARGWTGWAAGATLTLERELGAVLPQAFGIRLYAHVGKRS